MKHNFGEGVADVVLGKGENVVVIGVSSRRGHLVVEKRNHTVHVPYHYMEMRPPAMITP